MSQELSRRGFVARAAALAAGPAVLSARGAEKKINMGWIATGGRGYYLLQRAYAGNRNALTVSAVCDTYAPNLARGKDLVATTEGTAPKTFVDYRQLLDDKSIEAVVIATPEHLHHRMLLDAMSAGKHVYVEKPLAHTMEECFDIMKAGANSKSVIQVGTQNRSNSLYQMARTMIAQGVIGDCHYVRAFWYRNALPSGAAAWRYPIPAEANPQNADWKRFLGPAPQRDWQKERYFQWRLYWDYSSGIATDLMVHQTDITAFVLDRAFPASLVAAGGINRWVDNDDREVPDTWSVLIDYPDRLHVNYSCYLGNAKFGYGEQFCGNEGTLEIVNRSTLNYYPEVYAPGMKEEVKERKELTITIPRNDNLAVEAHLRNWVRSIHGLEKPVAPLQAGFEAAVIGLLSVVAYKQGRKVLWDAKNNKYSLA